MGRSRLSGDVFNSFVVGGELDVESTVVLPGYCL